MKLLAVLCALCFLAVLVQGETLSKVLKHETSTKHHNKEKEHQKKHQKGKCPPACLPACAPKCIRRAFMAPPVASLPVASLPVASCHASCLPACSPTCVAKFIKPVMTAPTCHQSCMPSCAPTCIKEYIKPVIKEPTCCPSCMPKCSTDCTVTCEAEDVTDYCHPECKECPSCPCSSSCMKQFMLTVTKPVRPPPFLRRMCPMACKPDCSTICIRSMLEKGETHITKKSHGLKKSGVHDAHKKKSFKVLLEGGAHLKKKSQSASKVDKVPKKSSKVKVQHEQKKSHNAKTSQRHST